MAHIFRKYTSNRGSALFMVISTMTALLISCMAMYMSMVSSRSSQYEILNQAQSYQTAQSIADIVYNSIADTSNYGSTGGGVLMDKLKNLAIGESITTGANGFKSLDPNNSLLTEADESQLGAYSVIITRLEDKPNGDKQFDICVMASVSGNRDTVHMSIGYNEGSSSTPTTGNINSGDSELFSATGYVPNDAYIDGGYYLTDVFYDTQFTYMNAFDSGSGENRIGYNLSTGGDLEIGTNAMTVVKSATGGAISSTDVGKIGPVTWAIRGNFTIALNDVFDMRGGSNVYVGGDITAKHGGFFNRNDSGYTGSVDVANQPINIYVNGDFTTGDGWLNLDNKNIHMYINGSLKKGSSGGVNGMNANGITFYLTDPSKADSYFQNVKTWDASAPGETYTEACHNLGKYTQTISYYKWDISGETNESDPNQHITIKLNASANSGLGLDPWQCTYYLSYDNNTQSAKEHLNSDCTGTKENGAIGKAFIIDDIQINDGGNYIPRTIVIDTGEDENNIINIKVKPNVGDKFMWFPEEGVNCTVGRNVIIRGRGTVLINVPTGVTYQDIEGQYIMHEAWWKILNGEEKINNNHTIYDSNRLYQDNNASSKIVPFIHRECKSGDGCVYTNSTSSNQCTVCHTALKTVHCSVHGDVSTYCPNCDSEKEAKTEGWCENHVDRAALDSYYASNASKKVTDSTGATIYPTTNFFLVSCDEGADFRFAKSASGGDISKNTLFGFIYAPYMTYKAAGGNNTGFIKLCGGLVVSDYDINGTNSFFGCYPEKMPSQTAGMAGGGTITVIPSTTRSWKVTIGGYN